jgi:uncharacterized protein YdhG (YjbR/CyaY superfamily)
MKKSTDDIAVHDIDKYLAEVPENYKTVLENLRQKIKELVPDAREVISYQIPTIKYLGSLVGFAAFKNHCSFFVMSKALMESMKDELINYKTATATIHFTPEKPLPDALVTKIVLSRMHENEMIQLTRQTKKAGKNG